MNLSLKTLSKWALFIGACVLLGVLLYVIVLKPSLVGPQRPPESPSSRAPLAPSQERPPDSFVPSVDGEQPLGPLPTSPAAQPPPLIAASWMIGDGAKGFVGYDELRGLFFRLNELDQVVALNTEPLPNVLRVEWAYDRRKAILEYANGANVLYDFTTQRSIPLPAHWQEFAFSGNGRTVAFKSLSRDPQKRYLATMDTNGANIQLIQPLGDGADRVRVAPSPNGRTLGFVTVPLDGTRQELFGLEGGSRQRSLGIVGGINFTPRWSPDGKRLLYSVADPLDNYRPRLWVVTIESPDPSSTHQELELTTTAHHCIVAQKRQSVICAVPLGPTPNGWGLAPNDHLTQPTQLVEVNLQTLTQRMLTPGSIDIVESPVLSPSEETLVVVNRSQQKLQRLTLPPL